MEATKFILIIILGAINIFGVVSSNGIRNVLYTNILKLIALGLIIFICSN